MTENIPHREEHRGSREEQVLPISRLRRLLELVGSFYAVAFAVAVGSLWLFIWLADEVLEREFAPLNREVLLFMHSLGGPFWDRVALAFTWLGSAHGIGMIAILFGIWLLARKRYVDFITLLVVLAGATSLTLMLKPIFQQVRPDVFPPLVVERNFSFPSGHSLASLCLWGFLGGWLVMEGRRDRWRWIVAALGLCMAMLVGLSRLYLGVHWPTDVAAGFLVGAFWVSVSLTGRRWMLARRVRRRKRRYVAHAPHAARQHEDGAAEAK